MFVYFDIIMGYCIPINDVMLSATKAKNKVKVEVNLNVLR